MARYTGYAVGFRGMVRHLLKRRDLDIGLRATRDSVPDGTEPELLELLAKRGQYTRLGVLVGFPLYSLHLGTRYKIIYSMYEANDIPFEWKSHVETADEVWVPTKFCAGVFGKYNRRIRLVPWGIDTEVFRRGKRFKNGTEYVFGAVGVQGKRKGTDVMVAGFKRAFGGRSGVRLVIKTRDTKWLPPIDCPNIEVVDEDWPEDRLAQFYRDIDCLLEPSRAEGIGMPPLQAAFCGTPSLVTNWSGPADYIDGKGVFGIRIKGLERASTMAKGSYWAKPDVGHLAELMQWAVDTKPKVTGDYSRWTLQAQADHFHEYIKSAWSRCS